MEKPRRYRKRQSESDDDEHSTSDSNSVSSVLADIRDVQKLRKRPAGLNLTALMTNERESLDDRTSRSRDPFKTKTGGFVDMRRLKRSDLIDSDDIEQGMKQTFSKESHLRDEDEEMRKYVEEELLKRTGQQQVADQDSSAQSASNVDLSASNNNKSMDDHLFQLPERLKQYQSKKNEEMLSNQMLCGIPEVDLGIESKIRNIEETEAAKLKLLKDALEKKKNFKEKLTARQNLAKDLAKKYVQHNIYNIEETTLVGSESIRAKRKRPRTEPVPVVDDDTPKWVEDGRTVERPARFAAAASKQPIIHRRPDTTKPTDSAMREKFKENFLKKK